MPYVHEFGIIDSIEKNKNYEYEPEKYNLIMIDGELIDNIYYKGFDGRMKELKTFVNNTETAYKDLSYYGLTLIPPTSLKEFLDIVTEENLKVKSKELERLRDKIIEAIERNKWMIHYGV